MEVGLESFLSTLWRLRFTVGMLSMHEHSHLRLSKSSLGGKNVVRPCHPLIQDSFQLICFVFRVFQDQHHSLSMLAPESILLQHDIMVSTWHIFLPCCLKNYLPLITSAGICFVQSWSHLAVTVTKKLWMSSPRVWETLNALDKMPAKPLWLLNNTQCFFSLILFQDCY